MPIRLTPLMKQRLTRRAHEMIERSLQLFPELTGATITVGYTRKHLGSATVVYRKGIISRLIIRLKVRKLTYQTIGHELTHLIQGLADIWTLARNPLFCDDPPTYLKMPRILREQWPHYADRVRELCNAAIEKRHTHRLYIRWLEHELAKLPKETLLPKKSAAQLTLPFVV